MQSKNTTIVSFFFARFEYRLLISRTSSEPLKSWLCVTCHVLIVCHVSAPINNKLYISWQAITCSKLTIETIEQGVKYIQCWQ